MLKNLTFLALLTAPAIAANTQLTITPTELKNKTVNLTWSEDFDLLSSWKLSFTLAIKEEATGSIFETRKGTYANNPYLSVYLSETAILLNYKTKQNSNEVTILSCERFFEDSCNITLSFVSSQNTSKSISEGIFTLTVNNDEETQKNSVTTTNESYLNAAILHKYNNNTDTPSYNYINTHGDHFELSNIELYQLNNRIVPEPTTATLSLVGLLSLLSRRKRK